MLSMFISKDDRHELFRQTRWRLTIWYAGIMGAVLIFCGLGVYKALIYAYRLNISHELDSVANELHEILEPILHQPGKLPVEATKVLPNLCLVATNCVPEVAEDKEKKHFPYHRYSFRLLDPQKNLVAIAGRKLQDFPPQKIPKSWQLGIDAEPIYYQHNALMLHTQDFQVWGYIQVGRSFPEYEIYLIYWRSLFLIGLPVTIIILISLSWYLAGKAMQPMHQSYQLLQQFTADAAHELRTPLAAISATVESTLMMSTITETEARETLQTIGRQNGRLSNLVADLLMLSRMDRQLSLTTSSYSTKEPICLAELTKDIAEDFASLAIKFEIKLVTQILVMKPLIITGNYEQLYRLISNLVTNALKYTNPGGEVKLILARRNKYALLHIQDTGIGIANEDLHKIFARFYRVRSDRSRYTGGFGLGLSIAQAIAHAHQGSIQVESQLGKGSIFTICLPANETKLAAKS